LNSLFELVGEYGIWIYGVLFIYRAMKSGSLPLFSGYAAQAGILELVPVVAATFAGGYLGDEASFAVAKR
jgi:membrane protein DedA with SNARE-associated domain